jgi:cyclophilin family peptidyl-prolyl cis-trans isomerase
MRRPRSPPIPPTADARAVERRHGGGPASPRRRAACRADQTLVRRGFYNGLMFHRVIPGFMAQGGDPKGTGRAASELPDLKAEFNSLPHLRGTVARRAREPGQRQQPVLHHVRAQRVSLDGKYTVFGRVISGMDASTRSRRASRRPSRRGSSGDARRLADRLRPRDCFARGHARRPVRLRASRRADRAAAGAAAGQRAAAAGRRRALPTAVLDLPNLLGPATCWCSTTPRSSPRSSKAGAARRASARPCTSARDRAPGGRSCATPSGCGSATRSTSAAGSRRVVRGEGRATAPCCCTSTARSRSSCCSSAPGGCRCRPTSPRAADRRGGPRRLPDDVRGRGGGGRGADRLAALHAERLIDALDARASQRETLTLHVGAGTFLPVKADDTTEHRMHAEWGRIDAATAERLNAARAAGGRLIAVGTTSCAARKRGGRGRHHPPFEGDTAIFITPGYRFKAVDGLITNFHLPRSTLFMLVSALMGLDTCRRLCPRDRAGLPLLQLRRREPAAAARYGKRLSRSLRHRPFDSARPIERLPNPLAARAHGRVLDSNRRSAPRLRQWPSQARQFLAQPMMADAGEIAGLVEADRADQQRHAAG